jgi:hypothetical protein
MIKQWTSEDGVSYEFITRLDTFNQITSTDPIVNPMWGIFAETLDGLGQKIHKSIFPAGKKNNIYQYNKQYIYISIYKYFYLI